VTGKHRCGTLNRRSTLALLQARILLVDDVQLALTADNLAILRSTSNAALNFHGW
jgi:hypothetical protein